MREKMYQSMIELTNGKMSSTLLKKLTTSPISKRFIRSYSKIYDINIEEVSKKTDQFSSLHEFFTRTLKEGTRPIDLAPQTLTSPVDAKIEAFGAITDDMVFTVKNKPYTLQDLLGSKSSAETYRDGMYIVFYLSPADYHRMHSPVNAYVLRQYVLGGKSYPVNQLGLTYGKKPLSHNYRMISELMYNDKRAAFIKVGATFVNSITLTNTTTTWHKGEEVGYFTFGSTVVMLFEKDSIAFCSSIKRGTPIRMGEAFANML